MNLKYEPSSEPLHVSAQQLSQTLYQHRPVGADASLAGVAELGSHQPLNRCGNVRVCEDNEGRVPAQLCAERDRYFIADQAATAPHLAHPGGCAALRIVLITVPCVSRSCEHFPDGFDVHLLLREHMSHFM